MEPIKLTQWNQKFFRRHQQGDMVLPILSELKMVRTVVEENYSELAGKLPMFDGSFIASLITLKLMPSNIKYAIETKETNTKKAMYLLDNVIVKSISFNTYFNPLLCAMEKSGFTHTQCLARKMRSQIAIEGMPESKILQLLWI